MPRIKTEEIHFKRADGSNRYRRDFHVDSSGMFSSRLPDEMADVLGFKEVRGKTLDECRTKWEAAREKYAASLTEVKRVIWYDADLNGGIMRDGRVIFGRQDIAFCEGLAVALQCGVYNESVTNLAGGAKRYRYEYVKSSIPDSLRGRHVQSGPTDGEKRAGGIIEWTAEREEFFAKMGESLERLILTLDGAFKSPAAIMALADHGAAGMLRLGA